MRSITLSLALLVLACSEPTRPPLDDSVASVFFWSPATSLCIGCETEVVAVALDARGSPLRDRPVTLTSSNEGIVKVTVAGKRIRGIAPGDATITATSESKSAQLTINVPDPGEGECVPHWDFC